MLYLSTVSGWGRVWNTLRLLIPLSTWQLSDPPGDVQESKKREADKDEALRRAPSSRACQPRLSTNKTNSWTFPRRATGWAAGLPGLLASTASSDSPRGAPGLSRLSAIHSAIYASSNTASLQHLEPTCCWLCAFAGGTDEASVR